MALWAGFSFLNLRKSGDYFKENIQVHAFLYPDAGKKKIDSLKNYIAAIPYARNVQHITKEMAAQEWNKDNDSTWKKLLDYNPLPESIDFYVKADHVEKDSLNLLSENLQNKFPGSYQRVSISNRNSCENKWLCKNRCPILFDRCYHPDCSGNIFY